MVAISVQITKYISDDPQPGIVECKLFDIYGKEWVFHDKNGIFSMDYFDAHSSYPQPGVIACEVIRRWQDADGREIVSVDTENSWGVEAITGETRFDVLPGQLVEI
jgi:hypothetical protein